MQGQRPLLRSQLYYHKRRLWVMQHVQGRIGTMIIDTKFYGEILKGLNGQKVRSAHLYQILTYLSQWHLHKRDVERPRGMLLYAQPFAEEVDLTYEIGRFPVRVRSIDLSKPWNNIHRKLLLAIEASPLD